MSASELDRAIEANDFTEVQILVEAGADLRHMGDYDATPLANAACLGRLEIVNFLLDKGADPTYGGCLPILQMACGMGHYEVFKTLLERGADPNETDEDGETCVFMAVFKARAKMLQLLLKHGANFEPLDQYLDFAIAKNSNGSHDDVLHILQNLKSDHP